MDKQSQVDLLKTAHTMFADAIAKSVSKRSDTMNELFHKQLELPSRGVTHRITRREIVESDETLTLFEETGPGCLLHWWLTYSFGKSGELDRSHNLRIRIFYDEAEIPAVDVTLAQFFAILLDKPAYPVDSAAIKVLPKNACNCYLPVPFQKMRIELVNRNESATCIWFMGDWQAYPSVCNYTPLRLHIVHRAEFPADPAGSFLMADFTGQGFVAGMTKGVRVKDKSDAWFHSGGDLWMLDGEGTPRALRGIGGEDIFNMSFGIWEAQTDWVGVPYLKRPSDNDASDSQYEGIMFRFFGPDPIWFDKSAVVRFGSKANDIETVVYAYLEHQPTEPVISSEEWMLAGPFECNDFEQFQRKEWAEDRVSNWPEKMAADFGQYIVEGHPTEFQIPIRCDSEHTWCDFARHFRGRQRTNNGTQPVNVSAYAVGYIHVKEQGVYNIQMGYDDWLKLWIDGKPVYEGKHDSGFSVDGATCELDAGQHEVRIKLSNANNFQWRLWAFSFNKHLT